MHDGRMVEVCLRSFFDVSAISNPKSEITINSHVGANRFIFP